jgi:hypothetical protein
MIMIKLKKLYFKNLPKKREIIINHKDSKGSMFSIIISHQLKQIKINYQMNNSRAKAEEVKDLITYFTMILQILIMFQAILSSIVRLIVIVIISKVFKDFKVKAQIPNNLTINQFN